MVVSNDGGWITCDEHMYPNMFNEVDIDHIENMKEIIEWVKINIGEKDRHWCWATPVIRFKKYDDAWKFLEWLEEYEGK